MARTITGAARVIRPVAPRYTKAPRPVGDRAGTINQTTITAGELLARARANDLNSRAERTEAQQLTIGGAGTLVPLIYGTALIGGQIFCWKVRSSDGHLIVGVSWCLGEIDAIEQTWIQNKDLPEGVVVTHHTGTVDQTADATLQTVYPTFTSGLPWVAYSVYDIRPNAISGQPRFLARVRGMKIRTSQFSSRVYSNNPTLVLADFIESTRYGKGAAVVWSTVTAPAASNDELVGGTDKRRTIDIAIRTSLPSTQWINTLRDYAGVFVVPEGGAYRFVMDAGGTSAYSFTADNVQGVTLTKRKQRQQPNVIRVNYTDKSVFPWRTASYTTADKPRRRVSEIDTPGITVHSQAVRYAIERYNESVLGDMSVAFTAFDPALALQVGDLFDVTHPLMGPAPKVFRLLRIKPKRAGRWYVVGREYDPAMSSDDVTTGPTTPDTSNPGPNDPPNVASVTATEVTYQTDNGTFASRVQVSWPATTYPFTADFRILVKDDMTVVYDGTAQAGATVHPTAALREGVNYTVLVYTRSTTGAVSTGASTVVTLNGKNIAPGNVLSLSAFEVGGRVFLSWTPADNPTNPGTADPDIWKYEVRRGATSDAWDAAKLVDRKDGLTCVDEGAPAGTWRYQVKAVDSVGQYSGTAVTRDIVVSADAASFLVGSYDHTSPTLTNMAAFTLAPTDLHVYYVTEDNVAWNTKFSSNLNTYSNPLATYHSSITSTWLGEGEDFGLNLSGQWTGTANATALNGTVSSYLGLSVDMSAWVYAPGLSQKTTARGARMKHEALTTSTLLAVVPTQNIRIDAVPRVELAYNVVTLASGGKLVQLTNTYTAAKDVQLQLVGAAGAAYYDRLLLFPETGLQLDFTLSASGFVFQSLSAGSRTVVSGDYIEFDVYAAPNSPNTSASVGIHLSYTDASASGHYSSAASGVWTAVKTALTVGKTINGVNFAASPSTAGSYTFLVRNVRITDGAGTTRLTLWASGEPSQNFTVSSSNASSVNMGPSNSLLLYAINMSNAQFAGTVNCNFQGI